MALDQMGRDALTSATVVPLLDARESELRETAWWIAERHPDWGEALAGYFAPLLANLPAGDDERVPWNVGSLSSPRRRQFRRGWCEPPRTAHVLGCAPLVLSCDRHRRG